MAKKKTAIKKKRQTGKKAASKKKRSAKKKIVAKKKRQGGKKAASKKKKKTKKKIVVNSKRQSKKKLLVKNQRKKRARADNKKIFEVTLDWSKLKDATEVYKELFKQFKLPSSICNDISRANTIMFSGALSTGKLATVKPPYLFVNINVSLAPYSVRDSMDTFISFFQSLARDNEDIEVILHREGTGPTIRSTPNPNNIDRNQFISLIACEQWPILEQQDLPQSGPARDNELKRLRDLHDEVTTEFVKTTTLSEELHLFVKSYSWDQGYKYLIELIQNPACDLNTALLIFWSSGAGYFQKEYKKPPTKKEQGGYHRKAWDLIQKIKKNFEAEKYTQSLMPKDFLSEVVNVPRAQQLWKIDSNMYGGAENTKKLKLAKKKQPIKKKAATAWKNKRQYACISNKTQFQIHQDLLKNKVSVKIQYFLEIDHPLDGSPESHRRLEAKHVSEGVAKFGYEFWALHYDAKDRLIEICQYIEDHRLPEHTYEASRQKVVEAKKHVYHDYKFLQPYEFVPNKKGINHIGGAPPCGFVVPQSSSGLSFQYLGLLSRSDSAFDLQHDLHLVYPLFVGFHVTVWLDYKKPLAPVIMNDDKVSDLSFDDLNEGDSITLVPMPFKTVSWPTMSRHGGHTGMPRWIQEPQVPTCPKTKEPMTLVAQLGDGELSAQESKKSVIPKKIVRTEDFGKFSFTEDIETIPGDGDLFIFFCKKSRIACYFYQGT